MQYTIDNIQRLISKRGVDEAVSCLLSIKISDENKKALGDLYDEEGRLCISAVHMLSHRQAFSFA